MADEWIVAQADPIRMARYNAEASVSLSAADARALQLDGRV